MHSDFSLLVVCANVLYQSELVSQISNTMNNRLHSRHSILVDLLLLNDIILRIFQVKVGVPSLRLESVNDFNRVREKSTLRFWKISIKMNLANRLLFIVHLAIADTIPIGFTFSEHF